MPIKINLDQGNRDVLDLSKCLIRSREELDRVLDKVPDFRTRPEKVRPEDLQIPEPSTVFSFTVTKAELIGPDHKDAPPPFPNPILPPMDSVSLEDMRSVDIDWRMLTTCRPANKLDENIFSRVVNLQRHAHKSSEQENEQNRRHARRGPQKKASAAQKASESAGNAAPAPAKGRKIGARHQTCRECGEEFCTGSCKEHQYEIHERLPPVEEDDDAQPQQQILSHGDGEAEGKGKKKKIFKKGVKGTKEKEELEEPKKKGNAKDQKTNPKRDGITKSKDVSAKRAAATKNEKTKKLEKSKNLSAKDTKATKKVKEAKPENKASSLSPPGILAPEITAAKLRKRSPRPRKNAPRTRTPSNNTPRARTPTITASIEIGLQSMTLEESGNSSSSLLKPPDGGLGLEKPVSAKSGLSPRHKKSKKITPSGSRCNSARATVSTKGKSSKPSSKKQSRSAADASNSSSKSTPKKHSPKKHDRNKSPETMVRRIKM